MLVPGLTFQKRENMAASTEKAGLHVVIDRLLFTADLRQVLAICRKMWFLIEGLVLSEVLEN